MRGVTVFGEIRSNAAHLLCPMAAYSCWHLLPGYGDLPLAREQTVSCFLDVSSPTTSHTNFNRRKIR
jgi:hypothetical protein